MSKILNKNETFGENIAEIFFVQRKLLPVTNADFYLDSKPENDTIIKEVEEKIAKNSKLIFYLNQFTGMQRFCILSEIVMKIIATAHRDRHPSFAKCYEIITRY